jgi:protein-disulfide isomerase
MAYSERTRTYVRRAGTLAAVIVVLASFAGAYLLATRWHDREEIDGLVGQLNALTNPPPIASTAARQEGKATAALSDSQRREIEGVIRNYVLANPEIIRDAINELQRKEEEGARVAQAAAITESRDLLFNSPRQIVLGNPQGDVTLVEFFDYNCAYCRRAHADMKRLLAEDRNLRFVLKEFPVLGDGSVAAAQIAAGVLLTAPDKYAAFHDALITKEGQVDGATALAVAQELGLDGEKLKIASSSDEAKANITEVRGLADKLQLTGTPSYVTRLRVVVGAIGYDGLSAEIASAREACKEGSC